MTHECKLLLPDGSERLLPTHSVLMDLAKSLGLSKVAVVGVMDGEQVDLSTPVKDGAQVSILTIKDEAALPVLRHSAAHLLANAVQNLFPGARLAIGPVIAHGFYYDFGLEHSIKEEDLPVIMTEMKRLVAMKLPVKRREVTREEALKIFKHAGENYKVELIQALPEKEIISLYTQGDFIDLCRGPHVPHTGLLKAFELTSVAGAYWRGDATGPALQRVYGTAWGDKASMKAHLARLAEIKKRDHRMMGGSKMDLFHFQEEAPGMVFWHPKGLVLHQRIEETIRKRLLEYGYQEVRTPLMASERLWELSGHAQKFSDDMFFSEFDDRKYAIKPMNCPLHVQIYNQKRHSYRDLPVRYAEFGCCHRNEPSGSLHGLMRTRAFVQDDAHIFCTPDQVASEAAGFISQLFEIYNDFGFTKVRVKLSTRPEKRVGDDTVWDQAEKALVMALNKQAVDWSENPGEGAFYGPKIEFHLEDCLGRTWQCGTLQLDFFMPERLGAVYIDENGEKRTPVMLHRAYLGSIERFMAILLEHHAGILPMGLAPIQVVVMNITDDQADYVKKITQSLKNHGIRAQMDLRNEKIGLKIRTHAISRVPWLAIVGPKELEHQEVALRSQSGEDLGSRPLADFVSEMVEQSGRLSG